MLRAKRRKTCGSNQPKTNQNALRFWKTSSARPWFAACMTRPGAMLHMETQARHRGRLIDHIQLVVKDLAVSQDHGAPDERPYHRGYHAAVVLEPGGNNIEAVYHGETRRSAPSVTVPFQ
jgi:hypothetical protein